MGMRDKRRNQKRVLARRTAAPRAGEGKDFLPLEGGPGKKLRKVQQPEEPENTATIVYIGHIPHGFYEDEMQGFFKQFGDIKRLRIAPQGKSKHYGFIEFESPVVAKIVADEMNNYLLFEHTLQAALVPPEKVHPKLSKGNWNSSLIKQVGIKTLARTYNWPADKGVRRGFIPIHRVAIERKRHNKIRPWRDVKRRKRINAVGMDYVCPALIGSTQPSVKKIKFDEA